MANRQRVVTLNQLQDGQYLFTWQVDGLRDPQQHLTSIAAIEETFPLYCDAVRQCQTDLNPVVPLSDLLVIAGYSYAETIPKRKRFQVYRHMAWANGWHERTQLPQVLEQAIKDTWSEVDEVHVGFIPKED